MHKGKISPFPISSLAKCKPYTWLSAYLYPTWTERWGDNTSALPYHSIENISGSVAHRFIISKPASILLTIKA